MVWVDSIEKALEILLISNPKSLGIGGLSKKLGSDGAIRLASLINGSRQLVELVINSNGIKAEGACHLARAIQKNQSIKSLGMFDNQIGDEGVRHVADALRENTCLEHIELGWNGIGEKGGYYLLEALVTNTTLRSLRLQHNSFSIEFSRHLRRVMEINSTLRVLDLRSSLGQSDAVYELISALEKSRIVELNLSGNVITDKEAQKLAHILRSNVFLEVLNISECCLGRNAAVFLADSVAQNTTLKELDLRYNQASNEGALKFGMALCWNTTLLHLDLGSNGIEDSGAQMLATALSQNSILRILGLGDNNIGLEGAVALIRSLRSNISLERINLEANSIPREILTTLVETIRENSTIQMIDLAMNELSYVETEMVVSLLRKNVDWRKASEMFVLVDSLRDGYFALPASPAAVRRTSSGPSCPEPPRGAHVKPETSEQKELRLMNAIRFLRILQTPALHYDLREQICARAFDKQGFIPALMMERSRQEILGDIQSVSFGGAEPRRGPGIGLSFGANSVQWARRIRGLGFEEYPKATPVPPMTFRLVTFLVASLISLLLVAGLSVLVVSILPM